MSLDRIRLKYPDRVPCMVHLPDQKELRLLFNRDDTIGSVVRVIRQRWKPDDFSESDALFVLAGDKMCTATTRLSTLDTDPPEAIHLHACRESVFG